MAGGIVTSLLRRVGGTVPSTASGIGSMHNGAGLSTGPAVVAADQGVQRVTAYRTAFTMSKIGRYIATIMPPTTTPRNTIMIGSRRLSSALTAASTSSS